MFYTEKRTEENKRRLRRGVFKMLLAMLPFFALCAAGFAVRNQTLCTAGLILTCAAAIFVGDLFVMPSIRYGRFLRELTSGLTRKTAGTLVRVGDEEVYENGVHFHEMIVNVYEDMAPEGERRFLIEPAMPFDAALIGRDVAVTSHDKVVLAVGYACRDFRRYDQSGRPDAREGPLPADCQGAGGAERAGRRP